MDNVNTHGYSFHARCRPWISRPHDDTAGLANCSALIFVFRCHWHEDMKNEIENTMQLIEDFKTVAKLAGVNIPTTDIKVETLNSPHKPPKALPSGRMAVYVFLWDDVCLKVGKVGPKSNARYTNQHYNYNSSNSNLARSILNHRIELGLPNLIEETVGKWIKSNTDRINIIINKNLGIPVLSLMESFLQCRLRPRFEGFDSQN